MSHPTLPAATPAPAEPRPLTPRQLKQIAFATLAALSLYGVMRWLPTGTNLHQSDFTVASAGPGSTLEFCDPANPQFLPVVAVRSPVETRLQADGPVVAGQPVPVRLTLRTSSGKAIGDADLLESHTRKLHVMAVDPTLTDYHHLHPQPGAAPGEWLVEFTPAHAGMYRFFCDFTPAATARGLYASADLEVAGQAATAVPPPAGNERAWAYQSDDYQFSLEARAAGLRAGEQAELALQIRHADGETVQLGEVMGAFAHLVAFDAERSGFAHLHPKETDLTQRPDPRAPRLTFDVTIPTAGRYVIWAQVVLDGREVYVPFWVNVAA